MAEVVGLRGLPIPPGKEPNGELVEMFEKYLAEARNGHIRSAAFAFIRSDDAIVTGWCGDGDNRMVLSGVATLQYRLAKHLDEQE